MSFTTTRISNLLSSLADGEGPPFSKAMPLQTLLLVKGDGTHRFLEGEEGVGFVGGINDDITPPVYKVGGPLPLLMTRRTSSLIKRDRGHGDLDPNTRPSAP